MGASKVLLGAGAALCLLGGFAPRAVAQSADVSEIVVTGSRLRDYDALQTPNVTLIKRADNLVVQVRVVCDTRDDARRREELKNTLRNLVRAAAQDKSVDLGVEDDDVVVAFDDTMLDSAIQRDNKPDTSYALLTVKTRVGADDTFDAASKRIEDFVEKTPKVGRTEVLISGEWQLTLIGPARYRPEVARLVAEDAKRIAALFGDGYGVDVQGLQLPVSWYRAGPLDLALYIPYKLTVRPLAP